MGQASFHAIVRGRVQGVQFRYYTAREAKALCLSGWVRNLPDGTVEVQASGEESVLRDLHRWLQQGPPSARVISVEITWGMETPSTPGFRITR